MSDPTRRPRGQTDGKLTNRQTIGLAVLFTLFMLAIAWVLVRYGMGPARTEKTSTSLWIKTERTAATAGQPVRLRARVVDARDQPVEDFLLEFWSHQELLGRSATDPDGYAAVTATFDRPGNYQVDLRPGSGEKRDWQVQSRASVPVVVEPAGQ